MSTMMTPREIVQRCIRFRDAPRIGLHFATEAAEGRVWPYTDFGHCGYTVDPRRPTTPHGGDEWGVSKTTLDPSSMGESHNPPLAGGWDAVDSGRWQLPDFTGPERYAHLPAGVAQIHAEGRYAYGHGLGLMLLPVDLRGMDAWFLDHGENEDRLAWLLDAITERNLLIIEAYHRAGMDGFIIWDDMGMNDRPLVSPKQFRRLYLPRYRRIADALHERGMHFIHHCCGQVWPLMDMFIEGGLDVLQLDQPELMGIDRLAASYAGKLCFWNCVDIMQTMPTGDVARIADEARRQVDSFHVGGGFMVKAYQQPQAIRLGHAALQAQYDAFMRYGAP
jgi:uroporphyrinogen decarboxylase